MRTVIHRGLYFEIQQFRQGFDQRQAQTCVTLRRTDLILAPEPFKHHWQVLIRQVNHLI